MNDHHTVWTHIHKVKHLAVIFEISYSSFNDSGFRTSKLSILAGMRGQPVGIPPG